MAVAAKKILTPVALLLGALGLSTLMVMSRGEVETEAPEIPAVTVDVARVVKTSVRIPIAAQGTVTPHRQTTLVAEIQGRIIEVAQNYNAGGFLAEGDVLLRIDDRDYQARLMQAQANVAAAHSTLVQERGRAEVALREWQNLPKSSQRSDEATALYLRKPQLEQAEAQLASARAELRKAQDDLDRTVIRAPYNALIRNKQSELGQYVSPGTPVADIFAVDYAEVRLPIGQGRLAYMELPPTEGFSDLSDAPQIDLFSELAGETTLWTGALTRTEGVFDERSRVLYAVVRVNDPYALENPHQEPLRVGSFVQALIPGRRIDDLVILPRSAMHSGNQVWVVDANQQLRRRQVSVLRTEGDEIYVASGLEEGELVCLTILDNSYAGALVNMVSEVATESGSDEQLSAADDQANSL